MVSKMFQHSWDYNSFNMFFHFSFYDQFPCY